MKNSHKDDNTIYQKLANEIALLLETKEKAYGQAFNTNPLVLKILYPHGVQPQDYDKLLYITRVLDKLNRIANNDDSEDPFQDICGYSLLAMRQRIED